MSQPTTGQEIEAQYKLTAEAFDAMSACERSLYRAAYALDVLHVVENGPPYENRGDAVDRYNETAGAALGSPWCAAFRYTMLVDSGVSKADLPKEGASVHNWREWAIEGDGYSKIPRRGDAGLFIYSATEGHLTSVLSVDVENGTVLVIAGNTNTDGSRDGYEVARKTYRISQFDGFADLSKLVSA